jgi:hypothetical protein
MIEISEESRVEGKIVSYRVVIRMHDSVLKGVAWPDRYKFPEGCTLLEKIGPVFGEAEYILSELKRLITGANKAVASELNKTLSARHKERLGREKDYKGFGTMKSLRINICHGCKSSVGPDDAVCAECGGYVCVLCASCGCNHSLWIKPKNS